MSNWIEVKNELPGDDEEVLAFTNLKTKIICTYTHWHLMSGPEWRISPEGEPFESYERVTHWQPLPNDPK